MRVEQMKKILSVFSLFFVMSCLFANDTYFFMASGQLVPAKETDIEIEMKEEIINIILEKDYYSVSVDFLFYNNGYTVNLQVGFPFFCSGNYGNGEISDFRCWLNNIETSYADYPIVKEWSGRSKSDEQSELETAYVRTITFPSKETTATKISYKSTYGSVSSCEIAKYLYGTGSSWKNSIGKMTVRIQNNNDLYRYPSVTLPNGTRIQRINKNTWECVRLNIEPKNYTDSITIIIGDIFGDDGPKVLNKDRYFGCNKRISSDELLWYTRPQLRLIRNAIYAFNGYPFKSPDLIELFEENCVQYRWYGWDSEKNDNSEYPLDEKFSEAKLSDIEKYNINLILEEENKLKKYE